MTIKEHTQAILEEMKAEANKKADAAIDKAVKKNKWYIAIGIIAVIIIGVFALVINI
jgi:hypothetical protein